MPLEQPNEEGPRACARSAWYRLISPSAFVTLAKNSSDHQLLLRCRGASEEEEEEEMFIQNRTRAGRDS